MVLAWLLILSEHRVSSKTGTKGKDRENFEEVLKMGMHRTSGPTWAGAPHYLECTDQLKLWRKRTGAVISKDQMHSTSLAKHSTRFGKKEASLDASEQK